MGGGGGKSKAEIQAEMTTNRENMAAMERQQQAALQNSTIMAAAGVKQAEIAANAGIKASKNAAVGGVIGAALGANTTHEEIKQWLPHEVGAATMASWDLAQKWNTTISMKTQGFQNVAIEYELSGKNYKPLFKDSQWNALEMARQTKQDMVSNARIFGIQSDKNPGGIPISKEEWTRLNSFKDPKEMLTVDPAVKAAREQAMADWESQMRSSGKGIYVDVFKNPQLGGSSILTMKGKGPLLDPSLAPLIAGVMKDEPQSASSVNMPNLKPYPRQPNPQIAELEAQKAAMQKFGFKPDQLKSVDDQIAAIRKRESDMDAVDANNANELKNMFGTQPMDKGQQTDWDSVIKQLTTGEKNPRTDEINQAMKDGLIDKYGMINAGVLMSTIPKELQDAPEFNMFKNLSQEDMIRYSDQYDSYSSMVNDPKLISEKVVGHGVTRRVKLNPDGSIAAQAVEGYMTDMMGNPQWVSMQGTRLQEFYDRQSMISGMGPLFPGILAPATDEELSGRFEPGFWGKNQLATDPRAAGAAGPSKPTMASMMPGSVSKPAGSMPAPGGGVPAPAPTTQRPTTQKPASVNTLTSGLAEQSSMPSGYEGAPLAAGG